MAAPYEMKIILLDSTVNGCTIPDEFRDECGALSICIPDSAKVNKNIKENSISQLDKLISNYTNSFEFAPEKRGMMLLQWLHNKRVFSGELKLRGVLTVDDLKLLDGFVVADETAEVPISGIVQYKIQIIGTHQQWKDPAKELRICDLDLGEYTWGVTEVDASWYSKPQYYVDGGDTIYPQLTNFGEWFASVGVELADIRLLVWWKAIMDAGFCALGYTVDSLFFNSEYFRKKALYLLKSDFFDYPNKGSDIRARFELTTNFLITVVGFPTEVSQIITYDDDFSPPNEDPGNNYDITTYRYTNNSGSPQEISVYLEVILNISVLSTGARKFRIDFHSNFFGPPIAIIISGDFAANESVKTVKYRGSCITMAPGDWFEIHAVTVGDFAAGKLPSDMLVGTGSYVEVTDCRNRIGVGDTFKVADMLRCDIGFYDLLLDARTAFNLRFYTREASKKIEIEPYPAEYFMYNQWFSSSQFPLNTIYIGFQGRPENEESILRLTDTVDICEIIAKEFKSEQLPVSYKFQFKKNGFEKYDAILDYSDESPPFSKEVFIPGGTGNKKKIDLKVIAPTFNDFDDTIVPAISPIPNMPPFIPFMWNTERPDGGGLPPQGYQYDVRLFHVYGNLPQYQNEGGNVSEWVFEGVPRIEVPTIAMLYPYWFFVDGVNRQSDANVVFGNEGTEKDMVNTFYQNSLFSETNEIRHTLKIGFTNLDLICYTPRKILHIDFEDMNLSRFNGYYRIEEIQKELNNNSLARFVVRLKALDSSC